MKAPKIYPLELKDLLKEISELAPFYTPEWKFSEEGKEPGAALMKIFARMFEGTVNRLNQVPQKNYIAFLNMLGTKLLPAQPARAPVTFTLSSGASEPVLIPAGTQVAAKSTDSGDPIIFETEKNMLATPAELKAVFSTVPALDRIFEHSSYFGGSETFQMFSQPEGQKQEHSIYLAHEDFLDLKGKAVITINFSAKTGSSANYEQEGVSWEWWNGEKWVPSTVKAYREENSEFTAVTTLEKTMEIVYPVEGVELPVTTNVESDVRFSGDRLLLIGNVIAVSGGAKENKFLINSLGFGEFPDSAEPVRFNKGEEVRAIDYPLLVHPVVIQESGMERVEITLLKNFDTPFTKTIVNGVENFWVRCRVLNDSLKTSFLKNLAPCLDKCTR
jgi:hypothetical protein